MEDEKDDEGAQVLSEVRPTENDEESEEEADIEMINTNDEKNESDNEVNFEYKLVGVVVHMGTADAGHYISYININRDQKASDTPEWLKTENDKWLEFNDSLVKDYK
jgi:ubiquitin C-terminal hydrolase